ncbi:hypothetical protein ACVW16_001235 [Bradyrhizobium sp. USDA 4474]
MDVGTWPIAITASKHPGAVAPDLSGTASSGFRQAREEPFSRKRPAFRGTSAWEVKTGGGLPLLNSHSFSIAGVNCLCEPSFDRIALAREPRRPCRAPARREARHSELASGIGALAEGSLCRSNQSSGSARLTADLQLSEVFTRALNKRLDQVTNSIAEPLKCSIKLGSFCQLLRFLIPTSVVPREAGLPLDGGERDSWRSSDTRRRTCP